MRVKTRICVECGSSFSYEIKRGRSRRLCGDRRCYNARKLRQRLERRARYPRCKTEGCDKPAERIGAGLCEACYGRLRRTGSTAKRSPRYRYATRAGYVKLLIPGHPLADSDGLVMEHRKVMYDMLGPGPQTCFWCGVTLEWPKAVVDHLNEDKQDNRPENLVVACNNCNRARGAMLPFIERLRPEAVEVLVATIKSHHDRKTGRGE